MTTTKTKNIDDLDLVVDRILAQLGMPLSQHNRMRNDLLRAKRGYILMTDLLRPQDIAKALADGAVIQAIDCRSQPRVRRLIVYSMNGAYLDIAFADVRADGRCTGASGFSIPHVDCVMISG